MGPGMTAGAVRLLVFGAGGQVGRELLRAAVPPGWTVEGRTRAEADVTRPEAVGAAMAAAAPTLVINAAADTAVDPAEAHPDATFAVNAMGAAHIARACTQARLPLVHLSTDYVFDGTRPGPWREDDPPNPLNVYGRSKLAGEEAVRAALPGRHVILRTSWIFSPFGRNFVRTMLRLGTERERLTVVDDQTGCPTAAADVAAAVVRVAAALAAGKAEGWGTFHFCGAGATTWFGFAQAIFREAARRGHPAPALAPIATDQYPTPARRPRNSVLECSSIGKIYGIHPRSWQAGLADCLDELLVPSSRASSSRIE